MNTVYQKPEEKTTEGKSLKTGDYLEELVRAGAREMLNLALREEVSAFLGRDWHERSEEFKGYRNGYGKPRKIVVGCGSVEVSIPRVSNIPENATPFESEIIKKYQRTSITFKKLLVQLYLEGLSSGDFEPVFRHLLGETAPLSPGSIIRLKEEWQHEYLLWRKRDLNLEFYAYIWADGVYLKAGLEKEKTAMLCILGVKENGQKELLMIKEGYRESKDSWGDLLRDLKDRGMNCPLLAIADGNLGIWAALDEVFPEAQQQRCWNHKMRNVLDKLPKSMQPEITVLLTDLYESKTKKECERGARALSDRLRATKHNDAADTLLRDFDKMTTFYNFPKEHWKHIRSSNPLESVFSGVRGRTKVIKRFGNRMNGLYMVFKIIERLSRNWRRIYSSYLLAVLKSGSIFENGIEIKEEVEKLAKAA